ncbi:MAG: Maltodextrin phosphorylase, partial [Cyanobacteriota bacterium]
MIAQSSPISPLPGTSPPDPACPIQVEDDRTGLSITTLRRALADNLFYIQGKSPALATRNDYYMALAYTVRDRLLP